MRHLVTHLVHNKKKYLKASKDLNSYPRTNTTSLNLIQESVVR